MDWDRVWWLASFTLLPGTTSQLTVYYLFWILAFLLINTIWDIQSDKTPPFHIAMLKEKHGVLYNASTFCSSLLIITAIVSPTVRQIAKDTTLPLILAGVAGILRAVPALCPYDYKPATK